MNGPGSDYTENFREFGIEAIRAGDFYGPVDWYVIFPDFSADAISRTAAATATGAIVLFKAGLRRWLLSAALGFARTVPSAGRGRCP